MNQSWNAINGVLQNVTEIRRQAKYGIDTWINGVLIHKAYIENNESVPTSHD